MAIIDNTATLIPKIVDAPALGNVVGFGVSGSTSFNFGVISVVFD